MENIVGFDQDKGKLDKNWIKHRVSHIECVEVFFNLPLMIEKDIKHSTTESGYYVLGLTHQDRLIFLVFRKRENKIRVISARDANRKDRKIYEKANTTI